MKENTNILNFIKWMYPEFSCIEQAESYLSKRINTRVKIKEVKISLTINPQIVAIRYKLNPVSTEGFKGDEILIKASIENLSLIKKEYQILTFFKNVNFTDRDFIVSQPIFYDIRLNCYARKMIDGSNVIKSFYQKNDLIEPTLILIVEFLDKLHSLKYNGFLFNKKDFIEREILEFKRVVSIFLRLIQIEVIDPRKFKFDLYGILESIRTVTQRMEEIKRKVDFKIIHGDFQPMNIVLGKDIIGVIDFDRAGLFSPLYDLASFLVLFDFQMSNFITGENLLRFKKRLVELYFKDKPFHKREIEETNLFQAETALRTIMVLIMEILNTHLETELSRRKEFQINMLFNKVKSCLSAKDLDLTVVNIPFVIYKEHNIY